MKAYFAMAPTPTRACAFALWLNNNPHSVKMTQPNKQEGYAELCFVRSARRTSASEFGWRCQNRRVDGARSVEDDGSKTTRQFRVIRSNGKSWFLPGQPDNQWLICLLTCGVLFISLWFWFFFIYGTCPVFDLYIICIQLCYCRVMQHLPPVYTGQ